MASTKRKKATKVPEPLAKIDRLRGDGTMLALCRKVLHTFNPTIPNGDLYTYCAERGHLATFERAASEWDVMEPEEKAAASRGEFTYGDGSHLSYRIAEGYKPQNASKKCPDCDGHGVVDCDMGYEHPCPTCGY